MKRKGPMPSYYRKNIAQHAQKKFLARHYLAGSPEACSSGPRVARRAREREARGQKAKREKAACVGSVVIGDEIGPAPSREALDRISDRS